MFRSPEISNCLLPYLQTLGNVRDLSNKFSHPLTCEQVNVIRTEIRRFTETGLETVDGMRRDYDVVVLATGFVSTFVPRMPIIGRGGQNLQNIWKEYPRTYMGMCQDGFPNWYVFLLSFGHPFDLNPRNQVSDSRAKYCLCDKLSHPDIGMSSAIHCQMH